jgi:prepilin-type N-terminal cleavage/methylation domain-containing protein
MVCHASGRRGFTLPEMLIAIVIIVLLTAMAFPSMAKRLRRTRINQAASVVAADLENAVSYAARQRKPVRITWSPGTTAFTVADRNTGTVIRQREIGQNTEWKVSSLSFSTATIDAFPAGITSGSLTITLSDGSYSRQVRLTRAGFVQVIL